MFYTRKNSKNWNVEESAAFVARSTVVAKKYHHSWCNGGYNSQRISSIDSSNFCFSPFLDVN